MRRALALVSRRMRWRWAALLPLAIGGAAIEAASAVAVFGLLRIVTDPAEASRMRVASLVYQRLPYIDDRSVVLTFTLLVMVLYLVRNVVLGLAAYAEAKVTFDSIVDVSTRMLRAYLRAPYAFFLSRNSAVLIHRVRRGSEETVNLVLGAVLRLASESLVIIAFFVLLAAAAPVVTLVAIVALTGFLLLPVAVTSRVFRRWGARQNALDGTLLQELQQSLGALTEVRMAAAEDFFLERFRGVRTALSRMEERRVTLSEGLRLTLETTFVLTVLVVVVMITVRVEHGEQALALLGLYGYAGFRLVPSANRITRHVNSIRGGRAFARALHDDLIVLTDNSRARSQAEPPDRIEFAHAIALEDVSYAYADGDRPALDHINLEIRHGESIGMLGPTGSGKSTLVAVLLGLLEPTNGRVLVDGRDIRAGVRSWQRMIGYVPQEFYVLDDTLRSNIALGVAEEGIDEARLRRAIELAQLDDVVAALPEGVHTPLGERGVRLSGGQRQRVAIARALYNDPGVLVFDEATAALDVQTESEITRAVSALQGERTVIVIAHRLSTVRGCSRLVILRDGRVADTGSYQELVTRDAGFRAIAAVQ